MSVIGWLQLSCICYMTECVKCIVVVVVVVVV
jgi:hypothetical protein